MDPRSARRHLIWGKISKLRYRRKTHKIHVELHSHTQHTLAHPRRNPTGNKQVDRLSLLLGIPSCSSAGEFSTFGVVFRPSKQLKIIEVAYSKKVHQASIFHVLYRSDMINVLHTERLVVSENIPAVVVIEMINQLA